MSLVREPNNRYDPNAVKVLNVNGVQVGHIKRELAKSLAGVLDRRLARIEGSVDYCYLCFFVDVIVKHSYTLCLKKRY